MQPRFRIIVGFALSFLVMLAACSSDPKSETESPVDAGSESALIDHAVVEHDDGFEASEEEVPDAPNEQPPIPTCPPDSWGNVPNTQCQLIEQSCESKLLTCFPSVINGIAGTSCTALGYGAKTRGAVCESHSECASGLACLAGNCTPFCCKEHQHEICGPGGQCSISLTLGPKYWVYVCGYSEPCTLWLNDCPEQEACHALITDGTASCSPPSSGSFVAEGASCSARNDCGDSQACVSHEGSGNRCRYLCKRGDSPWDAGAPNAQPGKGGCPDGQSCQKLNEAPDWLGVCVPTKPNG
mgnify:CR=1 FL=1